jgi:bacillithiol biosynthesis cysteine-adding enzyme BshC
VNHREIPANRTRDGSFPVVAVLSHALMPESVFSALLSGRPEAVRLLPMEFRNPDAWQLAADRAASRPILPLVADELVRQSAELLPSEARDRQLEKLSKTGVTVVVTGQQVGLFGGPLYSLHKAATAVARARSVEERTGRPCVPIFWLQTEDHDFPEIAECSVPGPEGRVRFTLPPDPEPSRISVAHRTLPREIEAVLASAEAFLEPFPHGAEVLDLLRKHYVAERPIAAAFAGLVAEVWQEEGLVILNPRVPTLARQAAPLFSQVLDAHEAIVADLAERVARIEDIGCSVQVPVRMDASLLFFHPDGIEGDRFRLVFRGGEFETPRGRVSLETLKRILEEEPLRFSTSALLRPLLQDSLLPTCAYVGGPAELSYFAELPPLYERLGIPLPLIAPRARLRVLDPTTRSLLDRLGVSAADVEMSGEALLGRVAARPDAAYGPENLPERLLGPLEKELESLAALGHHDLRDPIRRTREACAEAVRKLVSKVERTLLERDKIAVDRVERATLSLCPGGVPQERAYGFLALAARAGTSALTRAVLASAESFDPLVRDVTL